MSENNKFIKSARSNFKMRLFMLKNLPLAFLAGLKVTYIDNHKASVSIRYKFLNKNPFRSIYFAALSMAAELSSGVMAFAVVAAAKEPVSMLILEMKVKFKKKAVGKITFTCNEGQKISATVQESLKYDEGQTVAVKSVGVDNQGNEVAEFEFVWTFKKKN